ncbi:MAG: DUF3795 domain-containing protein [Desulfobacteraceae bacterium]|nr:DUF3795 domain-containing protein [Desulfobacteraceae bacterium]MBC2754998.1 DUF3795 domain-containing protein [Desulfobacteraceae bacterium]
MDSMHLIAPCGLACSACPMHLAKDSPGLKISLSDKLGFHRKGKVTFSGSEIRFYPAFKRKKGYSMDLNEIINFFHRLIVFHPFISMGIAAALGILVYIKLKEVLKIIFISLAIGAVCYILYCLLGATESGFFQKKKMIHKSL